MSRDGRLFNVFIYDHRRIIRLRHLTQKVQNLFSLVVGEAQTIKLLRLVGIRVHKYQPVKPGHIHERRNTNSGSTHPR